MDAEMGGDRGIREGADTGTRSRLGLCACPPWASWLETYALAHTGQQLPPPHLYLAAPVRGRLGQGPLYSAAPSQVDVHHVMAVRSALLRADTNLWQPLDFNVRAIGNALGGGDDEVNRALEQLLVGGNRHQVGGREGSYCL